MGALVAKESYIEKLDIHRSYNNISSVIHNMIITYSKCVHVGVYRHVVKLRTDTDARQALYYILDIVVSLRVDLLRTKRT